MSTPKSNSSNMKRNFSILAGLNHQVQGTLLQNVLLPNTALANATAATPTGLELSNLLQPSSIVAKSPKISTY